MKIETTEVGSVAIVRCEGSLDTNTSVEAQEFVNGLIDEGATKLLIDLSKVDFVSSAGLRILLVAAKRLGGLSGSLRICGLNETVNEVFEISGFSSILDVFDSEEGALKAF